MDKITLKTLPQASEQEVFTQVAAHLLTQQQKAEDTGGCHYHDKDLDLKCAAGCLIADEEYAAGMEGLDWETVVCEGYAPNSHLELIACLQEVHDSTDPVHWEFELEKLARKRGLEFTS